MTLINSSTIKQNIIAMGGTVTNDSISGLATAVLTIPQTITTNNLTGTITYKYHYHTSTCPHNTLTWYDVGWDGKTSHCIQYYHCSSGHNYEVSSWTSGAADKGLNGSACPQCGYRCGYSNGQIIGAEITY